ncbi:hypothetical protein OG500_01190 [Kitasatospora sp. NBC_01250]|nr:MULTISPECIES: hypothetical protein [unclassified Kitasatospora]WSJ64803.1 hypothetical protein OG294_01110 [Kitasatospora sp. NBC_01302]
MTARPGSSRPHPDRRLADRCRNRNRKPAPRPFADWAVRNIAAFR